MRVSFFLLTFMLLFLSAFAGTKGNLRKIAETLKHHHENQNQPKYDPNQQSEGWKKKPNYDAGCDITTPWKC